MEETEESRNPTQRLKSCNSGATASMSSSSSIPISRPPPNSLDLQNLRGPFRNLPPSPDSSKRFGIPPAHPHFPSPPPYLQIPPTSRSPAVNFPPFHSRSLSQPAFFSLDSLPPFNTPSPPFAEPSPSATSISDPSSSADVTMEDRGPARTNSGSGRANNDGLPPRKSHRRSQSDIPFDFRAMSGLPPLPNQSQNFPNHLVSPREGHGKLSSQNVKQETEGDAVGDDLFNAYMNLDSLDTLNSSGTEEKREDLDSRASGTKTNTGDSSENEVESSMNESSSQKREGNKRAAAGDLGASRHVRSLSMDSFMEKMNFGEESPKIPASTGLRVGLHSHSGSMDGTTSTFSLEFGNGEFSGAELKKIMANEKLAEIAMADPKRAKRILANRQSAARSKERKMRYISELEHKVQTLQTEATTLSAQLTLLQRDSSGLTNQNNELKFRLQAMEQQAHLRDALNEALTAEVQRLKLVTGESQLANSLNQQMQLNPQMFQMQQQQVQKQQQQSSQMSHFQMQTQQQSQQQQQQQKNNDASKHDTNK